MSNVIIVVMYSYAYKCICFNFQNTTIFIKIYNFRNEQRTANYLL